MSLLEICGLEVVVGNDDYPVAAIAGVDLRVEAGEVLGLVGESGAGKTMLGRAVAGLLPDGASVSGRVLFDGNDVLSMSPAELQRHRGEGVALCFQSPRGALSPVRRVGDQLNDRLEVHTPAADGGQSALSLLQSVDIRDPERRLRAYAHELSGGMAQRVMISLALACSPKLLVADEPTTGLDVTLTRSILELLRQSAVNRGQAVLIISHDLAAIAEVCDRIVVMYAGMLVEEAPTAELLQQPAHPYTVALLRAAPDISGNATRAIAGSMPTLAAAPDYCAFAPRCPIARNECATARPPAIEISSHRRSACFFASSVVQGDSIPLSEIKSTPSTRRVSAQTPPLLSLDGIEVTYRSRFGRAAHRAVRGVSLELRAGETLGIVGESGCGKTTLARVILALIRPTKGSVRFGDVELSRLNERELRRLRRRVQMVFQDPVETLNPRRTVEETLGDSLGLLDLPRDQLSTRIDSALESVGLDPALRKRRRHELSGGQAQRVGIARALALDPQLVVFDEPTSALDATVQAQILDLIDSLMADRRRGYVFISHDLATVRRVASRVVVLYLGKVVEHGLVEQVFESPLHPYTRALLASAPRIHGERPDGKPHLGQELDMADTGLGCAFAPRCRYALDRCRSESQTLTEWDRGHHAACWRVRELSDESMNARVEVA